MRIEGWEQRLEAWVEQHRTASFVWGQTDCAMFASGAVRAITGQDPFSEYRGLYDSEEGAELLLDEAGGFEALCTAVLGDPRPIGHARRGDLVFGPLRPDGAEGLAVCLGTIAATPGYVWRPGTARNPEGRRVLTGKIAAEPGLVFHKLAGFRLAYRID